MQDRKANYAALRVANLGSMSGRGAADEVNLGSRVGLRKIVGQIARYGIVGAAIALLPLQQQALAQAILPTGFLEMSTVPSNGDLNPYGVAFVPDGFPGGALSPGDILVSNFNNSQNQQGTGSTIVRVKPDGTTSLFFQGTPPLGLTTALGALKSGFVLVGNLPTDAGTLIPGETGSILVINRQGKQIGTLSDPNLLDGPWDLTILDQGNSAKVFVSNVLNGTVTRLDLAVQGSALSVTNKLTIAFGYAFRTDPAALVVGPTGLAYDAVGDILYVASTGDNEIFKILHAGVTNMSVSKGTVVYQDNAHLRGPLALAFAPNGHLVTSNGDAVNPPPATPPPLPSQLVEFTINGQFIGQLSVDPAAGGAFGLAFGQAANAMVRFAAVNDALNTIDVLTLNIP
jgi:DNA-binding beta-propeller fold protein YncE